MKDYSGYLLKEPDNAIIIFYVEIGKVIGLQMKNHPPIHITQEEYNDICKGCKDGHSMLVKIKEYINE